MRRIAGIVIFVIGVLLLLIHFVMKVQDIGVGFGITTIIIGVAIFGLSFVPQPEPGPDAPPALSPADRVMRVFYEPDSVFKNLRYHPHWLAPFLVIALMTGIYVVAYMQRLEPSKRASDYVERAIAGGLIPEDRIPLARARAQEEAAKENIITKIVEPLSRINGVFIIMLLLAGLYMLGVLAFGGRMNFWQALCVAVYSTLPPLVIGTILNLVMLYVKPIDDLETLEVQRGYARADLGLLFSAKTPENPLLLVHPYLYAIASLIGIFGLYGWWLSATGLRNAGSGKLGVGSAWSIVFLIWFFGVILNLIRAMLVPGFMV